MSKIFANSLVIFCIIEIIICQLLSLLFTSPPNCSVEESSQDNAMQVKNIAYIIYFRKNVLCCCIIGSPFTTRNGTDHIQNIQKDRAHWSCILFLCYDCCHINSTFTCYVSDFKFELGYLSPCLLATPISFLEFFYPTQSFDPFCNFPNSQPWRYRVA